MKGRTNMKELKRKFTLRTALTAALTLALVASATVFMAASAAFRHIAFRRERRRYAEKQRFAHGSVPDRRVPDRPARRGDQPGGHSRDKESDNRSCSVRGAG